MISHEVIFCPVFDFTLKMYPCQLSRAVHLRPPIVFSFSSCEIIDASTRVIALRKLVYSVRSLVDSKVGLAPFKAPTLVRHVNLIASLSYESITFNCHQRHHPSVFCPSSRPLLLSKIAFTISKLPLRGCFKTSSSSFQLLKNMVVLLSIQVNKKQSLNGPGESFSIFQFFF